MDIGNELPAEKRKERRYRCVAELPEVFAQCAVKLEAIALARNQRPFCHSLRAGVRILRLQAYAVAHLKTGRICERNFLIEPIAVRRQFGSYRGLFNQHRLRAASDESDLRLKINRVAKTISARQNAHRAAA